MYLEDYKDIDVETYRFFCKCMHPLHVLEVVIDGDITEIQFHNSGKCCFTFWTRIKKGLRFIFNLDSGNWSEFVIREQDKDELLKAIGKTNV